MLTKKDKAAGKTSFPRYTPEELDAHTILLVMTGGHLYGLAHQRSDDDYWRVVPEEHFSMAVGQAADDRKVKSLQTVANGLDTMVLSEKAFHMMLTRGVPQALEVAFARNPIISRRPEFYRAYRASMNVEMLGRFMRSVHAYAYGDRKIRRHAIRLSLNLREAMLRGGRYRPELSADEVKLVKRGAELPPVQFVALLDEINYYEVAPEGWDLRQMERQRASERQSQVADLW